MQAANKSLMDTIYDMYEPEWSDRERLERQARELELLWADYCHKLSDQVFEPLNTYSSQFPEVRVRMPQVPEPPQHSLSAWWMGGECVFLLNGNDKVRVV